MASRFSSGRSSTSTLHGNNTAVPDFYTAQDAPQSYYTHGNSITPYVAKRARLSQVWINRWTVLLFLVLVRLLLAIADYKDTVQDAEREALSACTSVESVGSAMASMPHYMSRGVNELTAHGVEKAINGLISMLSMSVTAVEALVLFAIHMLTQTYLCLITFAVTGSLHIALQLIEDATDFLNHTLGDISSGIHHGIDDFENALNGFTGVLNDIPSVFGGGSGDIPKLNIDDQLNALDNVRLPASIDQGIQDLNNSIPTFTQVNDFVDNVIKFPFEELKKLINGSVANYTFDHTLLPVPAKEQLTFCSENNSITKFFNGLIQLGILGRKIAIAVLVILAILVCIPMAFREIRRWRITEERAQLINKNAYDPLDVVYIAQRPYTASAGLKLGDRFASTKHQYLARWVVSYATTEAALFVLSLAIAGLFSCLCQYILLKAVEKEVPNLTQEVGEFAGKVVTALDDASQAWANGTNNAILEINAKINEDVLGWVNISTHAVNETLNTFVDKTMDVLNGTFGGTVLYDPIKEVFNCLIGLKIAGIERGLTWVSDHAHVDFPLLPNDIFSLSGLAAHPNNSDVQAFLADPSSGSTDRVSAATTHLVGKMASHIRTEAIISTCVLIVWFIVLFTGIGRALMLACRSKNILDSPNKSRYDHTMVTGNEKSPREYPDPLPPPPAPPAPAHNKTENDPFADPVSAHAPRGGVPSYAFFQSLPPTGEVLHDAGLNTSGNGANQYKGASYTLNPNPFPTFSPIPPGNKMAPQPLVNSRSPLPTTEKVGYAGERNVKQRPGHARKSSHAHIGGATPMPGTMTTNGADARVTFDRLGH